MCDHIGQPLFQIAKPSWGPGGLQSQHRSSCHGQCHKQCQAACDCPTLQRDSHLKPMSISRSPSSKISVCSLPIAWRLSAPCFRRSSRRPGVATRMWGGLFRRRLASVFTLVPPTTVCKGSLLFRDLHPACRVTHCTHALAVPGRLCNLFSIQDSQTAWCNANMTSPAQTASESAQSAQPLWQSASPAPWLVTG